MAFLSGGSSNDFDVVDGWRAEAIADYDAATPEEISFQEEDFIQVEVQNENGWWIGSKKGTKKRGLFPGGYVEIQGAMKIKVPKEAGGGANASPFDDPAAFEREMDQALERAGGGGDAQAAQPVQQQRQQQQQQQQQAPAAAALPDPELWNWGAIDRDVAVAKLKGRPEGMFLVRASQTAANTYSISVVQAGQVRHIRIQNMGGRYAINKEETPCATLVDLINQKTKEKLKSTLQGSTQSTESHLLKSPLVNPARQQQHERALAQRQQQQMAAAGGAQQPSLGLAAPPAAGGFGLAAPPTKKVDAAVANNPYARQRGGAAQVAATSAMNADTAAVGAGSRKLQTTQQPVQAAPAAAAAGGGAGKADFMGVLNKVWEQAGPVDNKLGGAQLRPIMMMSKLDNGKLGEIWTMVDTAKTGFLDFKQLGFLLGLMGQAQRGEALNVQGLGPTSQPPALEGMSF